MIGSVINGINRIASWKFLVNTAVILIVMINIGILLKNGSRFRPFSFIEKIIGCHRRQHHTQVAIVIINMVRIIRYLIIIRLTNENYATGLVFKFITHMIVFVYRTNHFQCSGIIFTRTDQTVILYPITAHDKATVYPINCVFTFYIGQHVCFDRMILPSNSGTILLDNSVQ